MTTATGTSHARFVTPAYQASAAAASTRGRRPIGTWRPTSRVRAHEPSSRNHASHGPTPVSATAAAKRAAVTTATQPRPRQSRRPTNHSAPTMGVTLVRPTSPHAPG